MTTDLLQTPVQALTAGAEALAAAFGLGEQVATTTEWPVDEGDSVLAATITGDCNGTLFLAVNNDVAARLSTDEDRLRRGFNEAAAALATALGGTATVEQVGATQERPVELVEVRDGDEVTAIFGFTSSEAQAAAAAAAAADGDAFEPVQLVPGSEELNLAALGPLTLLQDVEMDVTVELGRTTMPIRELLSLQPGMVVEIDRAAGAPIDVLVNGRLIALGEVVVIDEEFGIRITEIVANGSGA